MNQTRSEIKSELLQSLKGRSERSMKTFLTREKKQALQIIREIKACKSGLYLGENALKQELYYSRYVGEVETLQNQLTAYNWILNDLMKALKNN